MIGTDVGCFPLKSCSLQSWNEIHNTHKMIYVFYDCAQITLIQRFNTICYWNLPIVLQQASGDELQH
jgi:hypothetical protein